MDLRKFTSDSKDLLDRMYKEIKGEVLGYEDYLKLEPTEGCKNNEARIERMTREARKYDTNRFIERFRAEANNHKLNGV